MTGDPEVPGLQSVGEQNTSGTSLVPVATKMDMEPDAALLTLRGGAAERQQVKPPCDSVDEYISHVMQSAQHNQPTQNSTALQVPEPTTAIKFSPFHHQNILAILPQWCYLRRTAP